MLTGLAFWRQQHKTMLAAAHTSMLIAIRLERLPPVPKHLKRSRPNLGLRGLEPRCGVPDHLALAVAILHRKASAASLAAIDRNPRLIYFTSYSITLGAREMADAALIRRRIVTFSLVNQGLGGRDPIAALLPFLAPIAHDAAGQPFDGTMFRNEMRKRYGISLSRDVTSIFVDRLVALRLVRRNNAGQDLWVRPEGKVGDEVSEQEGQLEKVISAAAELHAARADLLKTAFEADRFLDALMRVLLNQNTALVNAVKILETTGDPAQAANAMAKSVVDPDEYFASEFIAWASEHRRDLFEWLADLGGTALVSEALIEIRTPQPNQLFRPDVTIYLDAPFLMELLGCSGAAAREDAKFIVDTLLKLKIPVAVLSHSVAELRGNLNAVLKAPPHMRTGATAKALLYREVTEQYLGMVFDDPEHFIANHNLSILDPSKLQHLIEPGAFTAEQEQSFYAAVYNIYDHEAARERDVASVAWIMRRRKGEASRDVLRSKHVLLSRNTFLARYATRFAIERCGLPKGNAGPVVLARDLAGMLWLLVGQNERHEISKRQLVLNCDRARQAAPKVVATMYESLRGINQKNADLLWIAVQRPTYLSMALDAASSTPGHVDQASIDATLEKIREDLVRDERAHAQGELEKEKARFDAEHTLQKIINETLSAEKTAIEKRAENLLDQLRRQSRGLWNKNDRYARASLLVARGFIHLLLISAAIVGGFFGTEIVTASPIWKGIVAAVVAIVLVYGADKKIRVWLRDRIGAFFTRRYQTQLRELTGEDYDEVLIASPALTPPVLQVARTYDDE
jgi:hypothetical protein